MLLHLAEDEHGWLVEPHGTEPDCWSTTFEGSEQLKNAGWRPYEMHRVSRHVIESLILDGLLSRVQKSGKPIPPKRKPAGALQPSQLLSFLAS